MIFAEERKVLIILYFTLRACLTALLCAPPLTAVGQSL